MSKIENFGDKRNSNGFDKNPQNINKTGANGSTISSYLKSIGQGNIVELELTTTNADGVKTTEAINLQSNSELNKVLAMILYKKALQGDLKAIKEILDRTEGKMQTLELKSSEAVDYSHYTDEELELLLKNNS